MAQIEKPYTVLGTAVEIACAGNVFKATVDQMPFDDPMRLGTQPLSERST